MQNADPNTKTRTTTPLLSKPRPTNAAPTPIQTRAKTRYADEPKHPDHVIEPELLFWVVPERIRVARVAPGVAQSEQPRLNAQQEHV